MAALVAITLPLASPFRDLSQVPLLEDPPVEKVPKGRQVGVEEDNPSFCELLEEIEAHTSTADAIDMENPNPPRIVQPPVAPVGSIVVETTPNPTPLVMEQSSNA